MRTRHRLNDQLQLLATFAPYPRHPPGVHGSDLIHCLALHAVLYKLNIFTALMNRLYSAFYRSESRKKRPVTSRSFLVPPWRTPFILHDVSGLCYSCSTTSKVGLDPQAGSLEQCQHVHARSKIQGQGVCPELESFHRSQCRPCTSNVSTVSSVFFRRNLTHRFSQTTSTSTRFPAGALEK